MPTKKQKELYLKNQEFMKEMLEERESVEEEDTEFMKEMLIEKESDLEGEDTERDELEMRISQLERRVSELEKQSGKEPATSQCTNLKFPGTTGTLVRKEVKFPRQNGKGEYYVPYK